MTLYRFIFFFHFQPAGRPFSGTAFIMGLRYDLKFLAIMSIAILLLCALPFINPIKTRSGFVIWKMLVPVLFLVLVIFLISDFYHYDYLHQKLNASVLNFLGDAAISFNMMKESYPVGWLLLIIVLLLLLFSFWHNRYLARLKAEPKSGRSKRTGFFQHLIYVLLLAILSFGKIGQFPLRWSDAFLLNDDFKANTALNPLQTFFSTLKIRSNTYNLNKVKAYYPLMSEWLGVKHPDSTSLNYERLYQPPDTMTSKPNIILVICESFSMYKSSMSGNPLDATPFFNNLCKNGLFFDRCFSPAFGTARGVWSTVTGLPDVEEVSTASRNPAAVDQQTIINAFKAYQHYYFLGGDPTWANIQGLLSNNIAGLKMYSQADFSAKKIDVWGISDKNLFLESAEILARETKPFFAIIQTADNHRPYTIPSEDQKLFEKKTLPDSTLHTYGFENNAEYNAFRYTDFCFRQFIERASKEAYFKNTVFVFVGDHGIRGDAKAILPPAYTTEGLTPEHIPLLYYSPGWIKPGKMHQVCSQVDLLPTLAGLMKQPFRYSGLGRNMLDSTDLRNQHPYAFIIDHDVKTIGLVSDSFYFWRSLKRDAQKMTSITGNNTDDVKDRPAERNEMEALTNGIYETTRYLMRNNKKKN
jgi:phosphoglycerol transferase MdoB-like AlkP superfamily enzyme